MAGREKEDWIDNPGAVGRRGWPRPEQGMMSVQPQGCRDRDQETRGWFRLSRLLGGGVSMVW